MNIIVLASHLISLSFALVDDGQMPINVINLERDTRRWNKLIQGFQEKNMPMKRVHRINPVNGKALSKQELRSCTTLKGRLFSPRGTIGCFMSHRLFWKKVLDEKHPNQIVLEDDAVVVPDFVSRARALVKELDDHPETRDQWDVLLLGGMGCIDPMGRYGPFRMSALCSGGCRKPRQVTEHCYIPKRALGTQAYILSKRGAEKLLNYAPKASYHVDVIIWGIPEVKVFICHPLLACQDDSPSTVGAITSGIETWIPTSIKVDDYTNSTLEWVLNEPIFRVPGVNIVVTSGRYILFGLLGTSASLLLRKSSLWLLPAHLTFFVTFIVGFTRWLSKPMNIQKSDKIKSNFNSL